MKEQVEFFSVDHKRLLSIATWAKHLAWIALIVYILWAGLQMFQYQNIVNNNSQSRFDLGFLRSNPLEAFRLGVNITSIALRGIIYYLVLKGISLGLNMIVETNINYREQSEA